MVLGWPGWYHSSRWRPRGVVGGGDLNCNRPICGGGRFGLFLPGGAMFLGISELLGAEF